MSSRKGSTKFHCNAVELSNPDHIRAYSLCLREFCELHTKIKSSVKYENFDVYVILDDIRAALGGTAADDDT